MDEPLRRWLRTPRGQIELIAVTFVVAIGIALFIVSQRAFFAKHAREKYPPASGQTERLARELEEGRPIKPGASTCVDIYEMWMASGEPHPKLPEALGRACDLNARLERTLVAGNSAQRHRAADLLAAAPFTTFQSARELGLRRARSLGDAELVEKLDRLVLRDP